MKKLPVLSALLVTGVAVAAIAQNAIPAMIVTNAKKDAGLNTIALPEDWANYGEIMSTFQKKYGLKITNASPQASSAEELQAVKSLKGQKRGPDVLDVGPSFAIQGVQEKLLMAYKPSTWASIPDSAKDKDGNWMGNYFGVISFGVNTDVVKNVPKSFADLLKPEYKGMVALNGNPTTAAAAFSGVWAAALANGGSLDNIQPGVDFFAKLKAAGNFTPVAASPATVQSGQTPIVIDWDYLNLAQTKAMAGKINYKTVVPTDGVYGSHYATAISAYAPNPNAAKLWMEFIASDEGQMLFLKGYAHPIRFNDMVKRGVIPQAMLSELPDAAVYNKVKFATPTQTTKAKETLSASWPKQMQ
ncbi:putative spermidine/putrescine transport system substrate-binding protein [Deinococcus metalli]|uniref:Iron ABC transporter substrate-binding protein n=1 Tax=Deinococcus metalli TaxID=1141878 RepID=A0A7W8KES4_9DEIO|nr:extracellular solute-binding protein [Deinococcus metalli]MBB5376824.1 putative spermidine/putrescine transport system substrate-binding protein [Deinococcus metalli]GHF45628.1 iron ABC transporter substrate-binding protein [Deinococcus metalli]